MERILDGRRIECSFARGTRRRHGPKDSHGIRRPRDRDTARPGIRRSETGGGVKRAPRRLGGWAVGFLACALLVAQPPNRLTAQTDPRLVEALRLAQSGQVDSGRATIRRLLARLSPTDSVYPEALLAAAKIAPDAQTVATNLNRIVVEYRASAWADDARLLLTELYFAQRDPMQTIQAAERLNRDYPDSPLRPRANFSAARAYFELKNDVRGCELIQQAIAGASEDVEFKNQVNFYAARCSAPPPSPTTRSTTQGGGPQTVEPRQKTAPAPPHPWPVQGPPVKSAPQVHAWPPASQLMWFG